MVERSNQGRDKAKAQREKKIKKVKIDKEQRRLEKDLRDVSRGTIDPESFDEEYNG